MSSGKLSTNKETQLDKAREYDNKKFGRPSFEKPLNGCL
jgi:hypothetical protein